MTSQGPGYWFFAFQTDVYPLKKAEALRIVGQDRDLELASNAVGTHYLTNRQVTGLRSASLPP
jgi:hypothetical protein